MQEGRRLLTRDELILALNHYLKLPFGKLHSGTPEIIHLANILGRTAGSITMQKDGPTNLLTRLLLNYSAGRKYIVYKKVP